MSFAIRKMLLPSVLVIIAVIFLFFWVIQRPRQITQERALEWILQGYPSQFCTTIYPELKDCVTFAVTECESIAETQVRPCIDKVAEQMPQVMTQAESQKYYLEASVCFEQNMHKYIMGKYLINTDECRQRMG